MAKHLLQARAALARCVQSATNISGRNDGLKATSGDTSEQTSGTAAPLGGWYGNAIKFFKCTSIFSTLRRLTWHSSHPFPRQGQDLGLLNSATLWLLPRSKKLAEGKGANLLSLCPYRYSESSAAFGSSLLQCIKHNKAVASPTAFRHCSLTERPVPQS